MDKYIVSWLFDILHAVVLGLRMTVGTKKPKIFFYVIQSITIYMINVKCYWFIIPNNSNFTRFLI